MLREQVLNHWTNSKEKLSTVQYLHQHKPLIIKALEFHLNQASSFTSEYSNPPLLNRKVMEQQKERLTKELEKLTQQQTEASTERHRQQLEKDQAEIKKQITNLTTILNDNTVINNFNSQKEKNERIVKECKELLSKLKGSE